MTPWLKEKLGRKLRKGEAIVGSESAYNISLGLVEMEGKLFGSVFSMVGVLDKTGSGLDTAVFISDENIEEIIKNSDTGIKPDQISVIFAKIKKDADLYKVMSEIENNIIEVDVVMRKDIGKSLITTLGDISKIFYLTMVLSTILSLFLVWAIFTAIANERTREVGIMRALGAKERHVVKLFLFEVLVLGAIGSIVGIVAGTSLTIFHGAKFFDPEEPPGRPHRVHPRPHCCCRAVVRHRHLRAGGAVAAPTAQKAGTPARDQTGVIVPQISLENITKTYLVDNASMRFDRFRCGSKGRFYLDRRALRFRQDDAAVHDRRNYRSLLGQGLVRWTTISPRSNAIRSPNTAANGSDSCSSSPVFFRCSRSERTFCCPRSSGRERTAQRCGKKAKDLLRMVGLVDKINGYPAQLSGGQQRRVAIARAFMNNPSLMLADEPTGDLDEETEQDMMNFFRTMNEADDITFLMVTHNTDLAKQTKRMLRMNLGSLQEL